MPVPSLDAQFTQIKNAFDAVPRERWNEWEAMDRFCDRLAQDAFCYLRNKLSHHLHAKRPTKGQLRFRIRHTQWRCNEEPDNPTFHTVRHLCEPNLARLPVDELMLGLICFRPKTIPAPLPREERQQLFHLIAKKTATKAEALIRALVPEHPERLQIDACPLYPLNFKKTWTMRALLHASVIGAGVEAFVMEPILNQGRILREKRRGPDGFAIRWKLAPSPPLKDPLPLMDPLCQRVVEEAMKPIKKAIAKTSSFVSNVHHGQLTVDLKRWDRLGSSLRRIGDTRKNRQLLAQNIQTRLSSVADELRAEYDENALSLKLDVSPSSLKLKSVWRHHHAPSSP